MALSEEDKVWLMQFVRHELENLETKLLTAFHQWASPIDNRLRSHSAAIRALDIELEATKDRLDKLDGGFPPPPRT